MYQSWRDLLFLHWRMEPAEVQRTLPASLRVDTFEGSAYVGIIPFTMQGIRPRFLPSVPLVSNFLEMNLRTYAHDRNGVPGVWFYSLDCNRNLAVQIARRFFGLPYFKARMKASSRDGTHQYSTRRVGRDVALQYTYRTGRKDRRAEPGSLEFFLVERYALFSCTGTGKLRIGRVHHTPYPLRDVELSAWDDRLFEWDGLSRPGRPPDHELASKGVDVEIFPLGEAEPPG